MQVAAATALVVAHLMETRRTEKVVFLNGLRAGRRYGSYTQ